MISKYEATDEELKKFEDISSVTNFYTGNVYSGSGIGVSENDEKAIQNLIQTYVDGE